MLAESGALNGAGRVYMGYETSLHLVDIKVKAGSILVVKRALKARKGRARSYVQSFLEQVVIDSAGFLAFKAGEDGCDPYVPDDEGTVPALFGKWYGSEQIARWLKKHSEGGGRLIEHSMEGDGAAWGWEFDGLGKMRALGLRPIGKWE
jgi:hypothetical protein